MAIEIIKTQESLELLAGGRSWPLRHCTHLGGVQQELCLLHHKTVEGDGLRVELTLLCLDEELVLEKMLKNQADMLNVLLPCLGEDEDIINLHSDKQICMSQKMSLTNVCNTVGALVRRKDISKYSWCPRGKVESFSIITLTNTNQMVSILQVKFGEDLGSM